MPLAGDCHKWLKPHSSQLLMPKAGAFPLIAMIPRRVLASRPLRYYSGLAGRLVGVMSLAGDAQGVYSYHCRMRSCPIYCGPLGPVYMWYLRARGVVYYRNQLKVPRPVSK